jgi:transposase-like protein
MPRSHPRYAPEYRQRIIELARAGRSLSELARQFEPTVETIRLWVKQAVCNAVKVIHRDAEKVIHPRRWLIGQFRGL